MAESSLPKYLLDTDTCVFLIRGKESIKSRLEAIPASAQLYTTIINAMELYYGAALFHDPVSEKEKIKKLIRQFTLICLNEKTIPVYCDIKRSLKQANQLIPENDLYIAALAIQHELTLVTHNQKHFQRISPLSLDDWVESDR